MGKQNQSIQWLERVEGDGDDQALSSRQIERILKNWRAKYPDLNPAVVRISICNQSRLTGDHADTPTPTDDTMKQWLALKALTDGTCYFTLCDEGEGYPVQTMQLFCQQGQYRLLFGLADFELDDRQGRIGKVLSRTHRRRRSFCNRSASRRQESESGTQHLLLGSASTLPASSTWANPSSASSHGPSPASQYPPPPARPFVCC